MCVAVAGSFHLVQSLQVVCACHPLSDLPSSIGLVNIPLFVHTSCFPTYPSVDMWVASTADYWEHATLNEYTNLSPWLQPFKDRFRREIIESRDDFIFKNSCWGVVTLLSMLVTPPPATHRAPVSPHSDFTSYSLLAFLSFGLRIASWVCHSISW